MMKIKLTDPELTPVRITPEAAGYDLKSSADVLLNGYQHLPCLIDTGVAVDIPTGYVGLVFSRSGFAKHNITLANSVGVIDSDYRGTIKVALINRGFNDYKIKKYDRIAQLVLIPIITPELENYVGTDDDWVASTARGLGGFGSTGQ